MLTHLRQAGEAVARLLFTSTGALATAPHRTAPRSRPRHLSPDRYDRSSVSVRKRISPLSVQTTILPLRHARSELQTTQTQITRSSLWFTAAARVPRAPPLPLPQYHHRYRCDPFGSAPFRTPLHSALFWSLYKQISLYIALYQRKRAGRGGGRREAAGTNRAHWFISIPTSRSAGSDWCIPLCIVRKFYRRIIKFLEFSLAPFFHFFE